MQILSPRCSFQPAYCRTLHDVDGQLSGINQLTAFQRFARRKQNASTLEDIALLLDDALAGILVRVLSFRLHAVLTFHFSCGIHSMEVNTKCLKEIMNG